MPSLDYYFCIKARFLLMTKPVFRADHCGSLIRPAKLRKARVDRLHGQIDDAALEAIEDEAILGQDERSIGGKLGSDHEHLSGVSEIIGRSLDQNRTVRRVFCRRFHDERFLEIWHNSINTPCAFRGCRNTTRFPWAPIRGSPTGVNPSARERVRAASRSSTSKQR